MTEIWLCQQRGGTGVGLKPTEHATEAAALAHAERLARGGTTAVVYPINVEEN